MYKNFNHTHNYTNIDIPASRLEQTSRFDNFVFRATSLNPYRLPFCLQGIGDRKTRNQVDTVFRKLDLNQDGVITLEEFIESCLKVGIIME